MLKGKFSVTDSNSHSDHTELSSTDLWLLTHIATRSVYNTFNSKLTIGKQESL